MVDFRLDSLRPAILGILAVLVGRAQSGLWHGAPFWVCHIHFLGGLSLKSGSSMKFFCLGINHHSARVELREQIAIREDNVHDFCRRAMEAALLTEVAPLSTCNRVEIYAVCQDETIPTEAISNLLLKDTDQKEQIAPHIFVKTGQDAVEHLFEVASGVDSMVLGETEILGQVKEAYEIASSGKFTGKIINRVFQKAFQTAKQVRSQTHITRGNVSVSSIAVTLAEKIFGQLNQRHVMIIGAGEMGEKTARAFLGKGVTSLSIVNRSPDKARQIADELGVSAHVLGEWSQKALETDIIVSSTSSPELVIHRRELEILMNQRQNSPLFLIDLAVPRDIDPAINWMDDCYLYNIDDLQAISDETFLRRTHEIGACQSIIKQKATSLYPWVKNQLAADPSI